MPGDTIEERIANAVAVEREACAQIAEDFSPYMMTTWDRPGGPPGNGARPTTFKDIAAAIRARAA